jgi:enoyl-CoA hydratase
MANITCTVSERIASIVMDDGKVNAMDPDFFKALHAALDQALAESAQVVIISGREGIFSGGLNVKLMPTLTPEGMIEMVAEFGRIMTRVFTFPLPVVAAMNGHAIAGGCQLAFCCDRRYWVEGPWRMQMNEMLTGLPFPTWMINIFQGTVPVQYLPEMLLHAHIYSPAETLQKGLIHGLAPAGEDPRELALRSCADLMILNQRAYAVSKKMMRAQAAEEALGRLRAEIDEFFTAG